MIPFLPLALILATHPGPLAAQHRDRHRRHQLAGHGAADPAARPCRSRSGPTSSAPGCWAPADWQQISRHVLPNVMPMVFANTTLTVADRDPDRDDAVASSGSVTRRASPGARCSRRVRRRRDDDRAPGGSSCRRASASCSSCSSFTLVGQALEEVLNPRLRRPLMSRAACDDPRRCMSPTGPRRGPLPAVRGVDLVVRPGEVRRRRRGVGVWQVDAGEHGAAAPAQGRHGQRRGAGARRRRAHDEVGRPARAALGRRVDHLPGRPALPQPGAPDRRPDRRADPAARAGPARTTASSSACASCSSRSACRRERGRAYPHQLSGGQRQRVMIAMALACRPQLIVADEPTTALDVMVQAQILALLGDWCASSASACCIISHDLSVLADVCDRVAGDVRRARGRERHRRSRCSPTRCTPTRTRCPTPSRGSATRRRATPRPAWPATRPTRATCRPAARSRRAARGRSTRARRPSRRCSSVGRPVACIRAVQSGSASRRESITTRCWRPAGSRSSSSTRTGHAARALDGVDLGSAAARCWRSSASRAPGRPRWPAR